MRRISTILLIVFLGCQKGADAPEVVLISAEVGAAPAPDTGASAAPDAAATPTPDVVTPAPDVATTAPDAAALREKLLALAVASECLRRGNTPPEQSAQTMLALYKAHGVDLDTYTREMSRLAGDPGFQAEIDAKTRDCPTAPIAAVDAGIAEVLVDGGASLADATSVAVGDTGPLPADTAAAAVDAGVVAVVDTRSEVADTKTEAIADTRGEAVPDTEVTEPEVDFSGTWTGQLYGGPMPGNLRVTIKGRAVTSAVATFGRISLRLKGSISDKGHFNVGGTAGKDFIRVGGQAHNNGRVINGTWDGVIDRKKANGRVQLKR